MKKPLQISKVAVTITIFMIGISAIILLVNRFYSFSFWLLLAAKLSILLGISALILTFLLNFFIGKERTTEALRNLTISGVTFILLIPMCELTVRFIYRDVTSTRDNQSYFCVKGYKRDIRLNRLGIREREFKNKKPDGVYRIAVIGDSFSFGQGIKEKERFSNILQERLNIRGKKLEVLNFGLPGKEMEDHLETLKNSVLDIHPDFILLQWFVNDFEGHNKNGMKRPLPLIPDIFYSKKLIKHSALYYLINDFWQKIQIKGGMADNYIEYLKETYGDADSPGVQKFQSDLRNFIQICRIHNIGIGVVLFPMITANFDQENSLAFLHEHVIKVCQQEKCDYLDLQAAFMAVKNPRSLWANRLDSHPGPIANRLAADHLIGVFGKVWREGYEL
jgi:hypothetical protein